MLRSTVGNASNSKMLETLLQNRLGLKYMQSRKLVASGREKLGMDKNEPWTPELEAQCIQLYEAEHGPVQERDYTTPEVIKTKAEPVKSFTPSSTPAAKEPEKRESVKAPAPRTSVRTSVKETRQEEPAKVEEEEDAPELKPEEEEPEPEPVAAEEEKPAEPEPEEEKKEDEVKAHSAAVSSDESDNDSEAS